MKCRKNEKGAIKISKRDNNKKISSKDDDNRVVGGETTGVNEYPWMALIVKRGEVARYMLIT